MPIEVSCPGCNKAYSVPDERAGQRFKCKQCGTAVSVPADEWGSNSGGDAFGDAYGTSAGAYGSSGPADSNNPYSAPYGAPVSSSTSPRRGSREAAKAKTLVCAIFLYVLAGLNIPLYLLNLVVSIVNGPDLPPAANQAEQTGQLVGYFGAIIGIIVMNIIVIVGAYHLQCLKKYSMAMTGAIIACIPCCSPCLVLGIPFGIWALVLLNNADIKSHFE